MTTPITHTSEILKETEKEQKKHTIKTIAQKTTSTNNKHYHTHKQNNTHTQNNH